MFILRVFPLRADSFLEQVVIGFQSQVGASGDIVLVLISG